MFKLGANCRTRFAVNSNELKTIKLFIIGKYPALKQRLDFWGIPPTELWYLTRLCWHARKKVVTADQGNELDHLKGALSPENPLIDLKSISLDQGLD